jgi:hypothetical protein
MTMFRAPWSTSLASLYFSVAIVACAVPLLTPASPLAGVLGILLTSPWSGLGTALLDRIDPALVGMPIVSFGMLAMAAAINTAILYWVGSVIESRLTRSS